MTGFSSWAAENWFNLIQSAGAFLTLLFAGVGVHREARAKEVQNLLTLAEHHRDLWSRAINNKDLERIFKIEADATTYPPTVAETEFLNLVFVHCQTGWAIARTGGITSLDDMKSDLRDFLSLPVPKAVWERTRGARHKLFVRFVDEAIGKPSPAS